VLYNVSDSVVALIGTSEYLDSSEYIVTRSRIRGKVTIGASKIFEVRHRCETTLNVNGFGTANNWMTEIYTTVQIWKIA